MASVQPLELPKNLDETDEENIPPAPAPEPPTSLLITPTSPLSGLTSPASSRSPPAPSPSLMAALESGVGSPSEHYANVPSVSAISTAQSTASAVGSAVDVDVPELTDGKKISIVVYLGQPDSFAKYVDEQMADADDFYSASSVKSSSDMSSVGDHSAHQHGGDGAGAGAQRSEFTIAYTYISEKTTWQNLDYIVRKTFKDYVARIDPGTNLGLNTDSITSYHLGEAKRGPEVGFPELLPCGYIVGHVRALYICLQGVGSLAFESLIPKSIVHRYISLLTEHRRLILCGPSGTGKSYLARKLAEFLVARSQRENPSEAIATFK